MQVRQVINPAPPLPKRKRAAGYTRVSSGKETMLHSLSAQISYYNDLIENNPEWDFAGVFVDEAITGTKGGLQNATEEGAFFPGRLSVPRPGFQKMLDECRAGHIDIILTKSISRFARNTVTVIESVRELKALGVDVFFEEQNIHSLSAEGELMLTILASFAQEESLSCSENVKWRVRKDFREGKVSGMTMLGYHLVDGVLTIIPEEAALVQQIFQDYLSGMGIVAITKKLRRQGVKISSSGVSGILRNEKYMGDMLLQKSFISDHISKRKVKNTGQLPQFYVSNSHEPIIPKEQFAAVQAEIARRSAAHQPKPQAPPTYPFSGLIKCGKCGTPYKRKHTAAGTKYEKIVWICDRFNELGKEECDSQQIPDDILQSKAAEVLALEAFDEAALRACVQEILVPGPGQLTFVFVDGHRVDATWQHPSRRHSWTPEMKEIARQRALAQHRKEPQQ